MWGNFGLLARLHCKCKSAELTVKRLLLLISQTDWLINLPLSIRVQTTLLASMYHALGQSLKKKIIFFGKKQIECGWALSVVLSTTILVITVVKNCCWFTWLCVVRYIILTTVITRIIVNKSTVQPPKWSRPRNDPQPWNDPEIDPEMTPIFLLVDPENITEWRGNIGLWIA